MRADVDVLIVGLGPVGATLAALLGELGVRTLVVEKEREIYPLPRAAHFDHEAMRLFQQLGIAEEVARHARPAPAYEFRAGDGQVLMKFDAPALPAASGWRGSYMFHQPGLELALRGKLAKCGSVETRIGWRFESLEQDHKGVLALIAGPDGMQTIRARYVVGCDGGSSPVRAAVGAELFDYGFDEPWLVIDARVAEGARVPDVNLQVCDPGRPTTCVLMGPGRHRWEFMLRPGETAEQVMADDFIMPLIAEWDCGPVEIERRAVYRFHGLVARQWRCGRVFLAGDAAHQMPPFAGQGMCSGLRDAANLAWKLAAVLDGADDSLLDTYQSEREPHVRAFIELAIGMGRVVCTLDPEAAARRDAAMLGPGPKPAMPSFTPPSLGEGRLLAGSPAAGTLFIQPWANGRGLDDVLGPGPWLITRLATPPTEGVTLAALTDPDLAPYATLLAAWLDAHDAEAVLVRPDRYVFGAGEPADLLSAWAAAHTPGRNRMTLRLHHAPLACSLASRLALMEAGLPHEIAFVQAGEQKSAEFARINPRGQVPALATDDGILTESTAILPYIADLAPDRSLLPPPGTYERAEAQAWLSYLSSTVHAAYGGLIKPEFAAAREAYHAQLTAALQSIDAHLTGRDYVLDQFGVCDLYLLVFCLWRVMAGPLPPLPNLDAFQQRILARPGIAPTIGDEMRLRAEAA